jgi:invasion protein IalB
MAHPSPALRASAVERHFSTKSGVPPSLATFRRLTAALPDVAKDGARRTVVIREPVQRSRAARAGAGFARNGGTAAFKAPSLPVQSGAQHDSSRYFLDVFPGMTRMGPDQHTTCRAAVLGLVLSLVTGALAVALIALGNTPAAAQGAVRSVHGDWQIRCDTPPGAQSEQCALIQSVVAEDRSNAGLTVIVLKTADQKSRLMRVVAPLGVLLPSGLGLKIDNADIGRAGFVRCLPNGCIAEVVMDDALVKKLQTGKTATFIIFQTPEEGIGFPMSLNGFAEGYAKLP